MGKAKSSENKDDNKKQKSFKNKSEKKLKRESKSLKSLEADQTQAPAPTHKSLNSLKKIQKQLKKIVAHRETENKKIKELKKNTSALSKQTTALSKQTTFISKQIEKTKSQFSEHALNKDLQRIKTALERKSSQFNETTNKLAKEITLLKDLTHRVEHKIQTLETEAAPSTSRLQSLNKNNELLFKKVSYFEEELNQFSDTFILPNEAITEFSEQLNLLNQTINQINENYQEHDTQIKLLQTDTGNIRQSLQQDVKNYQQTISTLQTDIEGHREYIENHKNKLNENVQQLSNTISTIEEAQQQLLPPLETHLQELEKKIQSLRQEFTKQQIILDDTENRSDLKSHQQDTNNKINQFNEQLLQSQKELKQHIQLLRESDQNADLVQFNQFNETLNKLSQQLSDVTEQSNNLQRLFSAMQEQKSTDNGQHDELSKQYLIQQQQLEKHDNQLVQLLPVISQNEKNEQQLKHISDSLEHLAHTQNKQSHQENDLQSNLLILAQKVDRGQSQYQKSIAKLASHQKNMKTHQLEIESHQLEIESHQHNIENHQHKMASHQQDQSVSLNQLSGQIKTRSQLFSIGLISVLTISTLLFFNQEIFNQIAKGNDPDKQELMAQLKTDITNETFTKINAISKQNSNIINQQFNRIRDSIEQVRKKTELIPKINPPIDVQKLQNTWQAQHQILQEGLSKTKTEQQELNQTMVQLSATVNTVSNQFQQLQKSMVQNSDIYPQNKQPDIEITEIKKFTPPFYTIQLLGALQKESVISFIRQHHLSDTSRIYLTEFQDKPWYILVQGHYPSFSQAKEKLQQLPEVLQKNDPWIKKLP